MQNEFPDIVEQGIHFQLLVIPGAFGELLNEIGSISTIFPVNSLFLPGMGAETGSLPTATTTTKSLINDMIGSLRAKAPSLGAISSLWCEGLVQRMENSIT